MPTATVFTIEVLPDASGAPALVRYGEFLYACNTLGETRLRLLRPEKAAPALQKIAHDMCLWAYEEARNKLVDAEWFAKNAALHAQG